MKRVLITGGAGFQGSNLADALIGDGYEVVLLNTFSEKALENYEAFGLRSAAQLVWGSVTDPAVVEKTVRDVDLVIHAAANIHVDESIKEPRKYYDVNVGGTFNVLEAVRKFSKKMIHISTCEVYGYKAVKGQTKLSEDSPLYPRSPYASSKAAADTMAHAYSISYGTEVMVLRPFNVFGPGQKSCTRGAVIPIFVSRALRNEPITVYGDGRQMREFVYIKDLVDAYRKAVKNILSTGSGYSFAGSVYNIGSGHQISIRSLGELIIEKTKSSSSIIEKDPRPGEVPSFVSNFSLFSSMFNWTPQYTVSAGLDSYVLWVKENG